MSLWRLPFRALVIESPLRPDAIAARIAGELDAPGFAGFSAAGVRPWIGTVSGEKLEMWRRIAYRNSFLPVVRARLVPTATGTRALVTMSLALLTRVVLGAWFFGATVAAVGLASTGEPVLVAPIGMMAAVVVISVLAFNLEANRAQAYLEERLAG